MTCSELQSQLSLYLYGELSFAEEEALESHLDQCPMCQLAWSREKLWHSAVHHAAAPVPDDLLARARGDLQRALLSAQAQLSLPTHPARSWHIPDWLRFNFTQASGRFAFASFFLFCGLLLSPLVSRWAPWNSAPPSVTMGLVNSPSTRIRDIQPEADGRVRILMDRLQQQEVVGSAADTTIRAILISTTRSSADPSLRIDSLNLLRQQHNDDVRDALLSVARHDSNAAVRLRALESLRAFPSDPQARETLIYVLQHDGDPGVRAEAINTLLPPDRQVIAGPELIRTLRGLSVSDEADDYIRARCINALRAAGSPDIY